MRFLCEISEVNQRKYVVDVWDPAGIRGRGCNGSKAVSKSQVRSENFFKRKPRRFSLDPCYEKKPKLLPSEAIAWAYFM